MKKEVIKPRLMNIIILLIIGVSLIVICKIMRNKEGFTWTKEETQQFITNRNTNNPQTIYNLEILQQNISSDELNNYFTNDKWTWSDDTKRRYFKSLVTNPYIREVNESGLNRIQKIYPEYAINYILNEQEIAEKKDLEKKAARQNAMDDFYPSGIGLFGFSSGLF
jgi:hypothetical protein